MTCNKMAWFAAAWAVGLVSTSANAGTFTWGDISDPAGDVMYLGVEESNAYATSLFAPEPGTGAPVATGNAIRFDPQSFQAVASNGATETTVSTLEMVLMGQSGKTVQNLMVSEAGDYTLSGLPSAVASASVAATFNWTILEVNNAAVTLPTQTEFLQSSPGSGPNGGIFTFPGDNGTAVPWTGSILLDFQGYLDSESIAGSATKVLVSFENELIATADPGSNAFIKKKEIGGFAIVANVPEPTSVVLLLGAAAGLFSARRR